MSCALRAYRCRPLHMLYLHIGEASRSSLSPSPTILLSPLNSSISPLMSHTHPTSPSSSNFQLIFDNALRAYERRTKEDLRNHPLADQLQDCNTPSNILDMLQQQVDEFNRSQRRNERWTRWLDPTVKVLDAFSGTLGQHVTSVCLRLSTCTRPTLSCLFDRHIHQQKPSLLQSAPSFWCVSFYMLMRPIVMPLMRSPLRQLRMSVQVKTLFLRSSNVLKRSFDD